METTILLVLLCTGVGYFLTDNFSRLLTILGLMDCYDGRKARKSAMLGLGLGLFTSLVSHSPSEVGYWLATANAMVWALLGGFLHSAALAVNRPQAYARNAFLVDHMAFITSDYYGSLMEDPVRLQAYLDRTYGKGLVNARDEIKRIQKAEGASASTMTLEGAHRAVERLNKTAGPKVD